MELPFDFDDVKKLGLLGALFWVLVPTGTPDDLLTFWLIGILGDWYLIVVGIVLLLAWWRLRDDDSP